MHPEIKIWLHRQPSKRDWKKGAKVGFEIPSYALERNPGLKKWVMCNCEYYKHLDGYLMKDTG